MTRFRDLTTATTAIFPVLVGVVLCGCRVVYVDYAKQAGMVSVRTLQLTQNDISGWKTDEGGGYKIYVDREWYDAVDGAAPDYLNNGLLEGGVQQMTGTGNEAAKIYIIDFGASENAEKMFADKKAGLSDPSTVPSFGPTTAILNNALSDGVVGYARFGQFYLEIGLSGFQDKIQSVKTLDLFLRIFKAKIEQ